MGSASTMLAPRRQRWLAVRVAFRWLAGRPLDGRPRTDSSFLLPGTRSVLSHVRRPSRWSMLAGWQRSAVRQIGVAAVAGSLWGRLSGHGVLVAVLWLAAVSVVLVVASVRTGLAVARWQHDRRWVRPLASALTDVVGHSAASSPSEWLTVPRSIGSTSDDPAPVVLRLPASFRPDPGTQRLIVSTVTGRLGLEHPEVSWQLVGAAPSVTFTRAPQPPSRVGLADVRELIAAAPDSAPILGLGVRGGPVSVDLDDESPHIALSAGTGAGKSVFARLVIAQVLASGGRVVILDPKRVSHLWARGLPGVAYCASVEDMHKGLIAVGSGVDARFGWIEQTGDESACATLPRVLVVVEEVNALIGKLTRYWSETRDKEDPKMSPAVAALGDVLFMGRQGRVHVLGIGQYLTARALGGPEARANFGTRVLARAQHSAWRMLAPEVSVIPRAAKVPGRMHVVLAGAVRSVQVAFLSPAECAELAVEGQQRLGLSLPSGASVAEVLASAAAPVVVGELVAGPARELAAGPSGELLAELAADLPAGGTESELSVGSEPAASGELPAELARPALRLVVPPVGLSAACEPGGPLDGLSVAAVRKARQRDKAFPSQVATGPGNEALYRPEDLARWSRNRPRARTDTAPQVEGFGTQAGAAGS